MKTWSLFAPLFAAVAAGATLAVEPATSSPNTTARAGPAHAEGYDALVAEYEAARTAWREAVRAAEGARAKKALREAHPAKEYWARFDALVAGGEQQALVWMLRELPDAGFERERESSERIALCERLVRADVKAPWFGEACAEVLEQHKELGLPKLESLVETLLARELSDGLRADALFRLGQLFCRSKDEAERARGIAYYERVAREFPDSNQGRGAESELFRMRHLQIGMVAPDFEAVTVDGQAFKLSDFRGKVVVLDFWGFW